MSMWSNWDSTEPKTGGSTPEALIDGDMQARIFDVEYKEGVGNVTSKIAGKEYAVVELRCKVLTGPNVGRTATVSKMCVEGDEEGLGYFRGFLVLLGLASVRPEYLRDVLSDPITGPKGKVVEVRARTKNGKQNVYLLRTLKDTETPTPFDEPTAPAEDFPF